MNDRIRQGLGTLSETARNMTRYANGGGVNSLSETARNMTRSDEGGLLSRLRDFYTKGVQHVEFDIAGMAGISKKDINWATELGKQYPGQLQGAGDAARHIALGWLARRTKNPEVTKFLVDARDWIIPESLGGKEMDYHNNMLGWNLNIQDKEQVEEYIGSAITNKEAKYFSPESPNPYYLNRANGGGVNSLNETARSMFV